MTWTPPTVVSGGKGAGTNESLGIAQEDDSHFKPDTFVYFAYYAASLDTFREWLSKNDVKGLDRVEVADFEQTGAH